MSIQPCSLANAISEPVNEIEPIKAPTTARMTCDWFTCGMSGTNCGAARLAKPSKALAPMAAAEPPPMPLYKATICGIAVIATLRPVYQASAVLIAIAMKISAAFSINTDGLCGPRWKNVAMTATSTPTPAHWMPLRAVTGEDMRLMPMMSNTAATK